MKLQNRLKWLSLTRIRTGLLSKGIGLCLVLPFVMATATRAADLMPSADSQALLSEAKLNLAQARKTASDPRAAAGHYLEAADEALKAVSSPSAGEASEGQLIYDSACQEVTTLLSSNPELWNKTEAIPSDRGSFLLRFAAGSRKEGTWDPAYFDFFRTPKQVHEKIAHEQARINDWGGVLVGVYKPADPRKYFLPPVGLAVAVTAALAFTPAGSSVTGVHEATLALYDPTRRDMVKIGGAKRPLAADFAAPLAYYPEPGLIRGLMAMIRPAEYEKLAGLYMLEPYDPDRIPVILVHGLLSIPQMWVPTISGIECDPELRGRYQFWVFAYPTGDPIAQSALKLRESLARVYQLYPKTKDMVLIGHSMGGLLSRMQSVTTGRTLWDRVFQSDADQLYAKVPADNLLKRALIYEANPRVARIVFICVPHRGSDLAINWIGSIGIALIRLPGKILTGIGDIATAPLEKQLGMKHLPTGINGLSPRSPVLIGMDTLKINAPYHSIIGDRGKGDTPNSSDGVVPYWSSHLAGAQSELIVPGPHGSFALPQTISELKRILQLHLASVSTSRQRAKQKTLRSGDRAVLRTHPASYQEPRIYATE